MRSLRSGCGRLPLLPYRLRETRNVLSYFLNQYGILLSKPEWNILFRQQKETESKIENKMVLHCLLLFFCVFFSAKTEVTEMVFQGPIRCKIGNKKAKLYLPLFFHSFSPWSLLNTNSEFTLSQDCPLWWFMWVRGGGGGGGIEGLCKWMEGAGSATSQSACTLEAPPPLGFVSCAPFVLQGLCSEHFWHVRLDVLQAK